MHLTQGEESMIAFVNVGPNGTFESSGDHATAPADVDALFAGIASDGKKALVIHFHGGLVSESKGVEIALKLAPVYAQADAVPLTFVWETGLIETFRDNLLHIHNTKLFQKLLKWVLRRVLQRFGGFEGKGVGVAVSMGAIEAELQRDAPFSQYDDPDTGNGAAGRGAGSVEEADLEHLYDELEAEFLADMNDDEEVVTEVQAHAGRAVDAQAKGLIEAAKVAKLLAAVAYRSIRRHLHGRDHGFYPTVVEEVLRELYLADLGAWVWGRMKDKAATMWLSNAGRVGTESRVGTYVLEKIAALQAERPEFKLHLIGHSAGSIAICELLRAAADFGVKVKVDTIGFMAPAGRCELGVAELARHPERFKRFRMYTMADQYEREDALVPKVYTRSLLYFISGVLEPDEVDAPIMGMMRHHSGEGPFASGAAAEWAAFASAKGHTALSDSAIIAPEAVEGMCTGSLSHGGFDDDAQTLASLVALLRG